jgi:hypothetical protein
LLGRSSLWRRRISWSRWSSRWRGVFVGKSHIQCLQSQGPDPIITQLKRLPTSRTNYSSPLSFALPSTLGFCSRTPW